ncbi:MAG: hypothetical protein KAT62_15430 [Desulfuromonadales bacterium]|nr:hypothetical protein [Desulfuromonadales bacterium]
MEESAQGLYSDSFKRYVLVEAYYNQDAGEDSAVLEDIDFSKFARNAKVEFHGCLTARDLIIADNFVEEFSEKLTEAGKDQAVVTGHTKRSNPQGAKNDYRHGQRIRYRGGKELKKRSKTSGY